MSHSITLYVILYLIVGEVFVALLLMFSRDYCRKMASYKFSEAVVSCIFVASLWPVAFRRVWQ